MTILWSPPPTFAAGQVLSAAHHLNALARNVQVLHDALCGSQSLFCGFHYDPWNHAWFGDSWTGWIRHKSNSFYYDVEVAAGGSAVLKVNDVTVATLSPGHTPATATLSGLTINQFYTVEVTGTKFTVWRLMETATGSFASLAGFTDETTPTAAQWQALSDNAAALYDLALPSLPVFVGVDRYGAEKLWAGSFLHQGAELYYDITLQGPYNWEEGHSNAYIDAILFVDGVERLTLRCGRVEGGPPESSTYSRSSPHQFQGTIDVSDLTPGTFYPLYISTDVHGSGSEHCKVNNLVEIPGATPTVAGWVPLPTWAHGYYICDDSPIDVSTFATDLALLQSLASYNNYPCRTTQAYTMTRMRRHRWLHYRNVEDGDPQLQYMTNEAQSISLEQSWTDDDPPINEWKVYDLDQAAGLYQGMTYTLHDIEVALEDNSA